MQSKNISSFQFQSRCPKYSHLLTETCVSKLLPHICVLKYIFWSPTCRGWAVARWQCRTDRHRWWMARLAEVPTPPPPLVPSNSAATNQHRGCKGHGQILAAQGLGCPAPAQPGGCQRVTSGFTILLALAVVPKPMETLNCPKGPGEPVWKVVTVVLRFRRTHNRHGCSKLMLHSLLWLPSNPALSPSSSVSEMLAKQVVTSSCIGAASGAPVRSTLCSSTTSPPSRIYWDAESEGKRLFNRTHCIWAVDKGESSCRLAGNKNPRHREGCSLTDNANMLSWSSQGTYLLSGLHCQNRTHHKMPRSWAQLGSSLFPSWHFQLPSGLTSLGLPHIHFV